MTERMLIESVMGVDNQESEELNRNSVTIRIGKARFERLGQVHQVPENPKYGNYGVFASGNIAELLETAARHTMLWQSKIIDENLRKILTPGQYQRALKINQAGKTVKFKTT